MNTKIKTEVALVIIIIQAIIIGCVVWMSEKKQSILIPQTTQSQVIQAVPSQEKQPTHQNIQTVDATAGWQVYQDKRYDFEVKYPSSYFIQIDKNGVKLINKEEDAQKKNYYTECKDCPPFAENKSMTIKIFSNLDNLSTADWLKQHQMEHQFEKDCQLNGLVGYCGLNGTIGGAETFFYLNSNKKIVEFSNVGAVNSKFSAMINDPIKNQILSTFKFTK